jgi:rhamnogalacturonan endolyase
MFQVRTARTVIACGCTMLLLASCGGGAGEQPNATQPDKLLAASAGVFGLSADSNFYTVDTGAGLVFKIRRLDNGSNTQSAGDIASMVYNGVEFQDQSRGSQLNSGFDYLYQGVSAVSVSAATVGTDYVKITVKAGKLTHYYMARRGDPHIYMGTHFTAEPDTLNHARFIVRASIAALPNGPKPSDIRNNTGAIESADIFGMANGETRSKHYSNMRAKDWSAIGATGSNVGLYMVRDNQEGSSGGPFYRSLLNQGTSTNQEITYIINYGEAQTEDYRLGVLNTYTLAFTPGAAPDALDTAWFANMGLIGYVAPGARGRVTGVGIAGRDGSSAYTVGFANAKAQYWATPSGANGYYNMPGMIPGTYTLKVYKNELAVASRQVTVAAGAITALNTITVDDDPAQDASLWRIGKWDGSPAEFVNGGKVTTMHPQDVRMSSWKTGTYTVGTSTPGSNFPAYQWKAVNGALTVKFNLTAAQRTDHTLRIGITTAFAGARPQVSVNRWSSPVPAASEQPDSRTLTVVTYRGNNTTFSYSVPASAFVTGTNTLTISPASGQSGAMYLSPGYSFDAVDLL